MVELDDIDKKAADFVAVINDQRIFFVSTVGTGVTDYPTQTLRGA